MSDTAGQQHGRPPASNVSVLGGTMEEWGLAPWRQGEPHSGGQHQRRRRQRWSGQGLRGEGRELHYVDAAEDFWQRQRPLTAEEVKPILECPHPHVRDFKKLIV